jgi:hypothetical protein
MKVQNESPIKIIDDVPVYARLYQSPPQQPHSNIPINSYAREESERRKFATRNDPF